MPDTQENADSRNNRQRHWTDYAAVWAASAAALAAGVAAAVGAWQASIANDQLAISKDSEQRQLRAYVGVTTGGVVNFGDPTLQAFKLIRKNFGSTPAYEVLTPAPFAEVIHHGANLANVAGTDHPKTTGLFTLFPTMDSPLTVNGRPPGITQQQVDLVKLGTEYELVYYGAVLYFDAFGQSHFTRYCWLFRGSKMGADDADGCLGHNDSN